MNRARIIAAASAAVVVAGGIGVAAALSRPATPAVRLQLDLLDCHRADTDALFGQYANGVSKATDPLTGGKVSNHEVIAVKVENIAAARPQVGLGRADITFVEEVEGAQTRLIAIYHSRFPKRLGPVRSARSTDVQLPSTVRQTEPGLFGANSAVQRKIDNASIVPLPRSTRDHRRVARHNVFVNLQLIAQSTKLAKATPIGWTFSESAPRGPRRGTRSRCSVGHDVFNFEVFVGSIRRALEWVEVCRRETAVRSPRPTMS